MTPTIMNDQTPSPRVPPDDQVIRVHSIWQTIQGEGPFAGSPATFVRLFGCNLQCPFCDTDYTSQQEAMDVEAIVDRIQQCRFRVLYTRPLVVITGGEPFRQNIVPLCQRLGDLGFIVQVETNGTMMPRGLSDEDHFPGFVVCSPKTSKVHPGMAKIVYAWKYVIESGRVDPSDGLPTSALGCGFKVARPIGGSFLIYVQPLDVKDEEENKLHLAAALDSSMRYGYRICLQLHKLLGLP